MEAREFEQLAAQTLQCLTELTGQQAEVLRERIARSTSLRDCLAIIEERGAKLRCCPHCQGTSLYRHGVFYGLQRYRCRQCKRSFNALTNTPLAFIRLRDKWLPFLQCMLGSMTVRGAADAIGIHRNTSFRWRHRFLAMAKDDRPKPLQGIVEADETYLLESQKGSRHLTRPARRRGGTASRRGISREHDCILVARDRMRQTCDFVTGRGRVTAAQLKMCLLPVLSSNALLVTDGARAYSAFAEAAGIRHRALNIRAGDRGDQVIHIQSVNGYHSRFKGWLRRFNGVASRYLPNYLGWQHELEERQIATPKLLLRAALLPRGS
jgi:transposase-like protein